MSCMGLTLQYRKGRQIRPVRLKLVATYPGSVTLHLVILIAYSLGIIGLGLFIGRRVTGTSDFFVARRQLGPA